MSEIQEDVMVWKVGAGLLVAVSLIGAIVRLQDGDYIYLSASSIGFGIAMWLWRRGSDAPAQTKGQSAPE